MASEKVREKDLRRIVDHLNMEGIQYVAYREKTFCEKYATLVWTAGWIYGASGKRYACVTGESMAPMESK